MVVGWRRPERPSLPLPTSAPDGPCCLPLPRPAPPRPLQVAETLPTEVLGKMHAPPKADYPIVDPHTINQADGFVFGFPTRFGMPAAQFKAFMVSSLVGNCCNMYNYLYPIRIAVL